MKRIFWVAAIAILATVMWMPATAQTQQRDIDSLLRSVRERDQKLRSDMMKYYAKGDVDSVVWCSEQIELADAENQRIVFDILDRDGWPEGLSAEASSAIFLVIDHADLDMQKRYYKDVAAAARRGDVDRSSLVTLRDRILMYEGKRQIYGTQTVAIPQGDSTVCYVWPVARPKGLDKRRSKVNLQPMEEYVKAVGESFGFDVVWDREITAGQLDSMRKSAVAEME